MVSRVSGGLGLQEPAPPPQEWGGEGELCWNGEERQARHGPCPSPCYLRPVGRSSQALSSGPLPRERQAEPTRGHCPTRGGPRRPAGWLCASSVCCQGGRPSGRAGPGGGAQPLCLALVGGGAPGRYQVLDQGHLCHRHVARPCQPGGWVSQGHLRMTLPSCASTLAVTQTVLSSFAWREQE